MKERGMGEQQRRDKEGIHCKNKLVVLTTEYTSGYPGSRQAENRHWLCILLIA